MSGFDIGSKHIGDGAPCFVIGEVGLVHDGSLRIAHDFIDAIADAGADCVKFQCHDGDPVDRWRIEPKWSQDENRQAYWKRTGFSFFQWNGLALHAQQRGLVFLCSPFSVEAVNMLDPLVPAWKVPSGRMNPGAFLDALIDTHKPAIVSTGMSNWDEIIWSTGFGRVALLQCTSSYPCPSEYVGLNVLSEWRERFSCPIGLSDHSGTIYAGLAAVALGCDVLEVHIKLSEYDSGPDASSSITPVKLGELVEGIRFIEKAKTPVDKDEMVKQLQPMRDLFMRQPVA